MGTLFKLLTAALITLSGISLAQANDAHHPESTAPAAEAKQEMTLGEIRKVDKEAGKLTIRHEELKNLEMPPMTMVFQVKDKAFLDQVAVGDKVSFVADKVDGKLTVIQLEAAQ
jgi:Cu(I)/Ag(I) efflux system periplasmic protein CusF